MLPIHSSSVQSTVNDVLEVPAPYVARGTDASFAHRLVDT